ncbi:MAG: hypothetical protein E6I76_15985 [Chloroflexi bacterium]|nr:MAG: hypothetical protein E6I76_15985 [Chloroflexota bacterium]
MVRRALAAAAPVTMAGVLQLVLGATSASAAISVGMPAQQPSLLGGVLQLLAPRPAAAPATAPAGSSSAHGLSLDILGGCVSCTSASAAPGHGGASATGLRLLGHDLAAGSADGHGSQGAALLSLPLNPLLDLALAGWSASADSGAGASSGDARSALTDLGVLGSLANVSLLTSSSHAAVSGASGAGGASSDGAVITLLGGALDLHLLHSGTDANGAAQTYLASVNGTTVGALSSSDPIPVSIPGVLDLALLQADAATGNGGTASAAIGTVSGVLGTPGTAAGVLGSTASGSGPAASGGGAPTTIPVTPGGSPSVLGVMSNPRLVPQTGSYIGAAGLGLVIVGTALAAASTARRRRRPAAA